MYGHFIILSQVDRFWLISTPITTHNSRRTNVDTALRVFPFDRILTAVYTKLKRQKLFGGGNRQFLSRLQKEFKRIKSESGRKSLNLKLISEILKM